MAMVTIPECLGSNRNFSIPRQTPWERNARSRTHQGTTKRKNKATKKAVPLQAKRRAENGSNAAKSDTWMHLEV